MLFSRVEKTYEDIRNVSKAELEVLIQRIKTQSAAGYPPFFGFSAVEDVEILLAIVDKLFQDCQYWESEALSPKYTD